MECFRESHQANETLQANKNILQKDNWRVATLLYNFNMLIISAGKLIHLGLLTSCLHDILTEHFRFFPTRQLIQIACLLNSVTCFYYEMFLNIKAAVTERCFLAINQKENLKHKEESLNF